MYIAFYKYKTPVTNWRSFVNRAMHEVICLFTRSKYSHCELVITEQNLTLNDVLSRLSLDCYSSSVRDGGVRKKEMMLKKERWDIVKISADKQKAIDAFNDCNGQKYDFLGAIKGVIPFFPQSKNRWYCSEIVAFSLGFEKKAGKTPQSLYDYLLTK